MSGVHRISMGISAVVIAGLLSSCVTSASNKVKIINLASHSLYDVQAKLDTQTGKDILEVELSDDEQAMQTAGAGGNRPTYVLFDEEFDNGSIEAFIGAELNGKGGPDTRGFAGILFHHSLTDQSYEAVLFAHDQRVA